MASSFRSNQLACLLLICSSMVFLAVVPPQAEAAISCITVAVALGRCVPYLQTGGRVDPGCCSGIKDISNLAKTTPDRQQVCICVKTLAASTGGINPDRASTLPSKCGVLSPFKITPSVDCSKIRY